MGSQRNNFKRRVRTAQQVKAVPHPEVGAICAYVCMVCHEPTVTIHVDPGLTTLAIRCQATEGCEGEALSTRYSPIPDSYEPTHEWYAPSREERRGLSMRQRERVDNDGLLIRPITKEPTNAS